jgi:hypothetical protein
VWTETPTNGRRVARLAGVALAALAGALLTPRAAEAGCGPRPMLPSGLHDAHQPQPPAPERQAPCHGPHCSSAPDRIPVAPAPTAATPADQYACLSSFPALPGAGDGARFREPSSSASAGHSARVERPPRP